MRDGTVKALLIGFAVAFCWPVVGLADGRGLVFGIPSAAAYLFFGWAALAAVLWVVSRRSGD